MVLISARVHASEVTGSFEIEGVLHFLTSTHSLAVHLRDLFVFKVVPMLNPEGALVGNSRASLTGADLNRRWDQPNEVLHPQIFYLKNLIKLLISSNREILLFCDLHSHTKKNNAFIYGCNRAANDNFCSWTKVRLLPRMLATKTPVFSYNDSVFHVGKSKWRTARAVVWKEFGVTNSFTLESSAFGYMRGDRVVRFKVKDYYDLSLTLLETLMEYNYVLEKLQKELALTRGWLKPSRLLALTGVLAADKLSKKIEKEKREEKIRKRMLRVKEAAEQGSNSFKFSKDLAIPDSTISKSPKKRINIEMQSKLAFALSEPQSEAITSNNRAEGANWPNGDVSEYGASAKEWRSYFAEEELVAAYSKLQAGVELSENASDQDSDSNPSEDNLPLEEINKLLCQDEKCAGDTTLKVTNIKSKKWISRTRLNSNERSKMKPGSIKALHKKHSESIEQRETDYVSSYNSDFIPTEKHIYKSRKFFFQKALDSQHARGAFKRDNFVPFEAKSPSLPLIKDCYKRPTNKMVLRPAKRKASNSVVRETGERASAKEKAVPESSYFIEPNMDSFFHKKIEMHSWINCMGKKEMGTSLSRVAGNSLKGEHLRMQRRPEKKRSKSVNRAESNMGLRKILFQLKVFHHS